MNYTFKVAGEIVFLIIVLSFGYDNFYTINQVSGRYVYEFPNAVAEGPNSGDTLLLRKNGRFESDTWVAGRYK